VQKGRAAVGSWSAPATSGRSTRRAGTSPWPCIGWGAWRRPRPPRSACTTRAWPSATPRRQARRRRVDQGHRRVAALGDHRAELHNPPDDVHTRVEVAQAQAQAQALADRRRPRRRGGGRPAGRRGLRRSLGAAPRVRRPGGTVAGHRPAPPARAHERAGARGAPRTDPPGAPGTHGPPGAPGTPGTPGTPGGIYANDLPHILRESGLLAAMNGHPRRARRLLGRSLVVAGEQGARHERAQTLVARGTAGLAGRLARRAGRPRRGTPCPRRPRARGSRAG